MYLYKKKHKIVVNIFEYTLYLYLNNILYKSYPIAIGKPSSPTPIGDFKITNKFKNPGGPFGSRWMGLSVLKGHYGIHGTNNPESIGTNTSHGCIRLYNKDIIELYNLVSIGTAVTITDNKH